MRIAHISDIHINASCTHLSSMKLASGINLYHTERLARFRKAVAEAVAQRAHVIVLSGDIFDKNRPSPQEYDDVASILDSVPTDIDILAIAGNHDEHGHKGSPLLPFIGRERHIVVAVNHPVSYRKDEAIFLLAPWGTDLRAAAYTGIQASPYIVISHVAVREAERYFRELDAEQGGIDLQDLINLQATAVLLGHYHGQTLLTPTIAYAGSLEVIHDFSEQDQPKGWLLYDIDQTRTPPVIIHQQHVEGPTFRTMSVLDFLDTDLSQLEDVYLRLTGTLDLQHRPLLQSLLRKVPTAGYKLDITLTGTNTHVETLHGKTPQALLQEYLAKKQQSDIHALLSLDEQISQQVAQQ